MVLARSDADVVLIGGAPGRRVLYLVVPTNLQVLVLIWWVPCGSLQSYFGLILALLDGRSVFDGLSL